MLNQLNEVAENSPATLAVRMRSRVRTARRAVDRRANATRPQLRSRPGRQAEPQPANPENARETESLTRVFQNLGVTYRRYRSQIGGPVAPGLRDAAYSFRSDPTFASLVTVAGFLDRLKLLE